MLDRPAKLRRAGSRTTRELVLPFELRQKSRLRTTRRRRRGDRPVPRARHACCATATACAADDGRVVRVVAADEDLLEVRCADADALARAAYHLGNRHTPVQVGAGWLRFAADDVLAAMLRGLGRDGDAGARAVRARGRRVRRRPSRAFERREARGHHPRFRGARSTCRLIAPMRAGDAPIDVARCRSCGCCSSRARRCRSARTAIRRGSNGRSKRATVRDARDARRPGSATCSSCVVARGEARRRWRLARRARAAATGRAFATWNAWFRASRETAELRAETEQMGGSLREARCTTSSCSTRRARRAAARSRRSRCRPRTRSPRAASACRADAALAALPLVVAREPGAGGDQARAARPGRRPADAAGAGRADSRASSRRATTLDDDDVVDASRRASRSRARATRRSTRGSFAREVTRHAHDA